MTELSAMKTPLVEFEVGPILVTEEALKDGGFEIHEEGRTIGIDVEKHGHKYRYEIHGWDHTKLKLAKDTVEGVISEAELTGDFAGLGRKIAEELAELD